MKMCFGPTTIKHSFKKLTIKMLNKAIKLRRKPHIPVVPIRILIRTMVVPIRGVIGTTVVRIRMNVGNLCNSEPEPEVNRPS